MEREKRAAAGALTKAVIAKAYSAMRLKNAAKCKSDPSVAVSEHNSALLCGPPRVEEDTVSPWYGTGHSGPRRRTTWDRPLL